VITWHWSGKLISAGDVKVTNFMLATLPDKKVTIFELGGTKFMDTIFFILQC
jgi:hypothetical protein